MDFEAYRESRLAELKAMDAKELRKLLEGSLEDPELSRTDRDAVQADLSIQDDVVFQNTVLERARMRLDDLINRMKSSQK